MKFGRLTLVETLADRWRGNVVALWRCECGAEKKLPMARVKAGQAKSCGCLKTIHGHAGRNTPEYVAWQAMHSRCRSKTARNRSIYAERGIRVCERWSSFEAFLHDLGPKPTPCHSLDRIDNNRGYEPGNVRWATAVEQQRNTRLSLRWHIKGKWFESCREAASHYGVDQKTVRQWTKKREDCHVAPRY
jgi:hypothetical protein